MVRRARRALVWLLALGGLLLLILQLPPVRAAILARALAAAASRYDLQITASTLRYNPFTLAVSVERVRVAARGTPATPIFQADRAAVDLGWSILSGTVHIQAIAIDRPRVLIVRAPDGRLNLPEIRSSSGGGRAALTIDRVTLRDLAFGFSDEPRAFDVTLHDASVSLAGRPGVPASFSLSAGGNSAIRIGSWRSTLNHVTADGTFDNATFAIDRGAVDAGGAAIAFSGTIDASRGGRGYGLRLRARGPLEPLLAGIATPRPLAGPIEFEGSLGGPLDAPRVVGAVTASQLRIDTLAPADLQARIDYSRQGLRLDPLELRAPWGRVTSAGTLLAPGDARNDLRVTWTSLHADVVPRLGYLSVNRTPAAAATGTARLQWGGGSPLALRGSTRLAATERTGRVPLAGTIGFEVGSGGWTLRPDVTLDTFSISGALNGSGIETPAGRTPLGGTAHVTTASLAGVERILRAWGFEEAAGALETLDGAADVSVSVGGRLGAPTIVADASVPGFTFWRLPGRDARAHVVIDPGGQRFEAVAVELGGMRLLSDRIIRHPSGSLEGGVRVSSPDPHQWIDRFAPGWTGMVSAAVEAAGDLTGTIERPQFDGDVSARNISAAGQAMSTLTTRLRASRERLDFDRLEARQPIGSLHAAGTVTFADSRLDVRGNADQFEMSACDAPRDPGTCAWTLPLAGIVTGTWDLTDLLEKPSGTASLDIAGARWSGIDVGGTHAEAQFDRGRTDVAVDAPDLHAAARGTVDIAREGLPFDVTVQAARTDVRDAAARLGASVGPFSIDGQVSGRARLVGELSEVRRARVDATIDPTTVTLQRTGAAGAQPVTVSLERPTHLRLGPDEIGVEQFSARFGSSSLTADGLLSLVPGTRTNAHLELAGPDVAAALSALALAPATDAAGRLVADLTLTGSPAAPTIQAKVALDDGGITVGGETVSGVQLRADVTGGMLTIGQARATWRDTTADGSGAVPLAWLTRSLPWWPAGWQQTEPPRARATSLVVISASPGMLLADRMPAGVPAGGQLDIEISLAADGPGVEHLSGDIRVTNASMTVANALITQRGEGHAAFMHGRVLIAPWVLQGSGTNLTVQGSVDVSSGNTGLDLQVKGPIGLAPLRPIVGFDMAGTVAMDLHVTGTATTPLLDGSIDLHDLAMRLRSPRLVLADTRGMVTFDDGVARFDDVTATANGAPVLVRGTYDLAARRAPDLSLTAAAVPLQVVANGPRLEADVNVRYTADAAGPLITGRVEILPQPYRGSILAIQNVVTQFQEQFLTRRGGRRRPGRATAPTRLDIALVSRDDLVVDSNVGRVELQTDLRLAGTAQEPVLLGAITSLPGGVLRAGGRTYRIERGMVRFDNPRETQPMLELVADTHIGAYDITMNVNGTFDALRTSLRSDPPLAESDLRSLLVTGRLVSDSTGRRDLVDEQRVVESLSSDLFGFAAKAIGLDTVSIGVPDFELIAGGIDASTSLNVSKSFSRQVEIIFSQDLQNDTYSWVAIYRPFRSTSFRALSRETRDAAIEVRQEHRFGGGVPAPQPVALEEHEQPEVSQVLFFGPHGAPDEVLLEQVKLHPGNRFDPWEWQADRERLYAFYAQRGYRQPRIRATRTPAAGGIRLEYDIVQGPRTTLSIDGHRFPKEVMAQFDDTWRDALTPEFLVEDLEEIARRHLIDDGYLRPQVRVTIVVDTPGTRAVLMSVNAGPHTESREVVFTSNTVIPSAALEQAIETAGASRRIWYDPANVIPIVQAAYRARGYLETTVEAGPIEVFERRAELPVAITEGRLFRIARLEFVGNRALGDELLAKASGLHVGDPLSFPAIRAARQRLQAFYIERGFGDAQVRSEARVDRPTASLAPLFTIEEGVRRVIADLSIRGNVNTRTKVISDYAELQRATPVTPALVSDLQKRLYDMGVFTSVAVDFKPAPLELGSVAERAAADGQADATQPVVAVVTVQEAPRYSMRYGLQLTRTRETTGTEVTYGPGAGADFRDRDLLGRAIVAGMGLRYDRRNQSVQGLLSTRRTYGADVSSNLFVTGRRERSASGSDFSVQDNTMSVTAEQRKRLSTNLELAWAFAYDYRRLAVRRAQDDALALAFSGDTVGPRVALAWDSRDNPFDATHGWFHSSAVDFGIRPFGSDVSYARYLLQHFQFVPVGKMVLASGLRLGALHAFGEPAADPVSLDLLFTAGGSHSVRGYAEDSLGPPAIANLRLGNRQLLVLNQEVRFPLWKWFKGVAFIDAGNTFPTFGAISLSDLRVGAGAGLRLATPVGLFRMDVGYPINPRPEDTTRVYFSIGQAF